MRWPHEAARACPTGAIAIHAEERDRRTRTSPIDEEVRMIYPEADYRGVEPVGGALHVLRSP